MRAHILVVEDEKHLGVGIKYNLEAEGYRVTLVEDGPTALRVAGRGGDAVDLIVLDLMLPGMSGYAVCETIRKEGSQVPILMLSARTLAEDRSRGFDVGANQYLTKPFELVELISRVKNLLAAGQFSEPTARPTPAAEVIETEFGQMRVNFATHEALRDGQPLRMTPKELRLLKYFVENPNRVISRQELLREVWELNGNVQTRAVDQFIMRLRKAIEQNVAEPIHLLTIRDAGYRFLPDPQSPAE